MTARGRRRPVAGATVDPVLARLRDRAVAAWVGRDVVDRVAELRSRAVRGDHSARRDLWTLGARSAVSSVSDDPAPAEVLVAEIAAWRRACAVSAWRNADPRARRHVEIDPPGQYVDELAGVNGGPDLAAVDRT